ncbi:unnamed protein product [Ectocarpus fasciculatus]
MGRRGRSSTLAGMQRTASLLFLAVLAGVLSIASSFVASNAAIAFGRQGRDSSSSSSSNRATQQGASSMLLEGARGRLTRRQRSSCLGAGDGEGEGASSAVPAVPAAGGKNVAPVGEGEAGLGAGIAPAGRQPSLASQSAAPARTEIPTDVAVVGAPQQVVEKEYSIEAILKELAEIQNQGPKNVCVLGTRHCSFLHQQIIELLAYALVLSGNHVFTSGAMGTNAATIRGALRAERKELLTVVLPQSLEKQSAASRELIQKVTNVVTNPVNDHLPLDAASRLCNSDLLSRTEQLICFAFHDSKTIIETTKEARSLNMIVTELYLD